MPTSKERAELERVLQSEAFHRAPNLQKFLSVVCEHYFQHHRDRLNQFVIATEALGRQPDFDPTQNSIVRVQAREVRRRLQEYYQGEGRHNPLRIEIPVGSYCPVFRENPQERAPPLWRRKLSIAALILVAFGAVLAIFVFPGGLEIAGKKVAATPAAGDRLQLGPSTAKVWNRFTEDREQTLLILSNWPELGAAAAQGPNEYTGIGEALALHLITRVFGRAGGKLIVKQARIVTADDVRRYNVVALGGRFVNPWTSRLAQDLDFTSDGRGINIARPLPAERVRYEIELEPASGNLTTDYGVVSLRRHPASGHWVLLLFGVNSPGTSAAAECIVNERFLSQLRWPDTSRPFPESFQILIRVGVHGGVPETATPVSIHVP